jgi:hypothetical protein
MSPPSLVDKNFRGKFVEHQKRAASSVNLAALGKVQLVRFLDDLPQHEQDDSSQVARPERAKEVDAVGIYETSRPSPSPTVSASSSADGNGAFPALTRTKSQLSVLIDKERRYSTGLSASPENERHQNRTGRSLNVGADDEKSTAAIDGEATPKDEEKEDELLVMARKGSCGLTRDPDQPFRAAAKKGLWRDGTDGPQSPPPLF